MPLTEVDFQIPEACREPVTEGSQVIKALSLAEDRLHDNISSLRADVNRALESIIGMGSLTTPHNGSSSFKQTRSGTLWLSGGEERPVCQSRSSRTPLSRKIGADEEGNGSSQTGAKWSQTGPTSPHGALYRSMSEDKTSQEPTSAIPIRTAKSMRSWPHNIELRTECLMFEQSSNIDGLRELAQLASDKAHRLQVPTSIFEKGTTKRIFRVIKPESSRRLTFECLSLFVLMFDSVYTPFYLSWDTIPVRVALPIQMLTTTFWTIDLSLSFVTGYHTSEGLLEMRLPKIAKRYMRSWFGADLACVVGDLLSAMPMLTTGESASGNQSTIAKVLRVAKLARFLRLIGMVRMLRIMNSMNEFMEAQMSELWRMLVRILQISISLLWLGHLCACAWWSLGKFGPKGEINADWTELSVGLHNEYIVGELSVWYQYVTAYHWGLAQLTLGAHDINPLNGAERIFTVCANLFGLLFGGTLIAILSNTLIDLKDMNAERTTKLRKLKEFLMQHEVDISIRMRVLKQVQDRVRQRRTILVEKDVKALHLVSQGVLRALRFSLSAELVRQHSVFRAWDCISESCVEALCASNGTEYIVLLPDDELFKTGTQATVAYHITRGTLYYATESLVMMAGNNIGTNGSPVPSSESDDAMALDGPMQVVVPGSWLSEATWWCHWYHVGTARTEEPCTVLCISPQAVLDAMSRDVAVSAITAEYARLFHSRVVGCGIDTPPNDMRVHYAEFSDLMFAMPPEVHIIVGVASINQAIQKHATWLRDNRSVFLQLEQEISEGRSMVLLDHKTGNLQRQVALALLRIENEEQVLVQVASYDREREDWVPSCKVPGTKQKFGEVPNQTIQRFVEERLQFCAGASNWETFQTYQEAQASAHYGVGTTYTKHTFTVKPTELVLEELEQRRLHVAVVPSVTKMPTRKSGDLLFKREEVGPYLAEIKEVYLLNGSDHTGLYAWIDMNMIDGVVREKDILTSWVTAVCESLPEVSLEHNKAGSMPQAESRKGQVQVFREAV